MGGKAYMKYLVTAGEMKRYDANTIEKIGIPEMVLMERAALAAFEEIKRRMTDSPGENKILILAGTGNNGGDGLALARLFAEYGCKVDVWCVGDTERASLQWKRQFSILKNYPVETGSKPLKEEYNILVDALFGVGLSRNVTGEQAVAIEGFNGMEGFKVALDIPSGIDSDTGKVLGTAVRSHLTVTFGFHKRGLVMYPGCLYCGEVRVYPIGIGETSFFGEKPGMFFYDEKPGEVLPFREPSGNKGTFGKVLLAAGSLNMAGAAVLAAKAAYRAGAGMVKVITPEENRVILQQQVPEALLGKPEELAQSMAWADVIAAGPGLSTTSLAREILCQAIRESTLPLVLDADALNLLSMEEDLLSVLSGQGEQGRKIILTPHVGELSRITGRTVSELKEDLPAAGRTLARRLHAVVAAKDARTFICGSRGPVCVNRTGNSGMATAGSGDVLTGIIAGLLAQNMDAFEAAAAGVYLHGLAGDEAAVEKGEYSLTAGDIIEHMAFGRNTEGKNGDGWI